MLATISKYSDETEIIRSLKNMGLDVAK